MQITLSPACFEGVDEAEVGEGFVGIPHTVMDDHRLTLGGKGLLMKLISLKGELDLEAEKGAELKRRARGDEPENIDEYLAELVATGWVTLPEA